LLCEEPGVSLRGLHQVTRTSVNARRGRPPTRPEMSSGIAKQRTHGHCEMKEARKQKPDRVDVEVDVKVDPLFEAVVHKLVDTSGSKTGRDPSSGSNAGVSPDLCKPAAVVSRHRFSPSNGRLWQLCSQIGAVA
jgi:hypothetical protein